MKRGLLLAAVMVILVSTAAFCQITSEFRSMEINAWHGGFESPSATTAMVNYSRSCNLNCVIPEVRLRSDAYYVSTLEPPGTGVGIDAGYDPLKDVILKAHAQSMEVMPWVVTYRVWSTAGGPGTHYDPIDHLWWTHGPGRPAGADNWLMYSDTGAWDYGGVVNLDPGHPAVEDYLIRVFMEIVGKYDVDGLILDYIRYPSTSWGYNPVSVARYNAEYGTVGNPSSTDPQWLNWRRDQVSNLVKRLYLEIKATKLHVKLGIDGWITAGSGSSGVLQDWDTWMKNHWLDFCSPMTYTSDNTDFQSYLDDAYGRQYTHHIYPKVDVGNATGTVTTQVGMVQTKPFPGTGLYCYYTIPDLPTLKNALTTGNCKFPTFVPTPDMPWLSNPSKGYIKGFIQNASGNAIYPATATILGTSFTGKDSGTGFYGFTEVTTGTYTVRAEAPGYNPVEQSVTIVKGEVADLDFTLPPDTVAPVITNVRSSNVQGTNAQILWDTNEAATSQVDYGTTTGYGTTTAENMTRVTAHTVQLVQLTPSTLYHYRVRSYDAGRNMTQSGDYTFTTASGDTPGSIIVDDTDPSPNYVTGGSWFSSTSANDKYGSNYNYCSASGGTKTATWRPSVISAGRYNVYAWWPAGTNRTTNAPYFVQWSGGSGSYPKNQQNNGGKWNLLVANVQFSVGTTGYVQVSNTGITPTNVMADAIKLEPVDATPPTPPTNLTASALSPSQMSLSWTASTDNVGVAGYRVSRNSVQVGTPPSNSYTDSGLTANTQYSYFAKAYDAANNESAASASAAAYTLSVAPGASSVTCDKPVSAWQTTPTFTFTAAGGFGAGKVQYYKYAWTQSSTHSWTGFESQWNTGTLPLQATGGSWYLHVKGFNGDNVENGNYTFGPYKYDGSAVQITNLNDGKYTNATGQLHASWTGADPDSGVTEYQYMIAIEGGATVRTWTSTGTTPSVTTTGLTLAANTKYIFSVKALNGAGMWSDPVASDGVTAGDSVASILEAKKLHEGDVIMLTNRVISADLGAYCYACDSATDGRISAIRVDGSAIEGDLAGISGKLALVNGEWVIQEAELNPESGPGAPNPILVLGKAVGGETLNATPGITDGVGTNNIGVLVTIVGKVENPGTGYFMVNDGSVPVKVSTERVTDVPSAGQFVKVTGIVSTELSDGVVTPIIIPRGNSDVPQPWH